MLVHSGSHPFKIIVARLGGAVPISAGFITDVIQILQVKVQGECGAQVEIKIIATPTKLIITSRSVY